MKTFEKTYTPPSFGFIPIWLSATYTFEHGDDTQFVDAIAPVLLRKLNADLLTAHFLAPRIDVGDSMPLPELHRLSTLFADPAWANHSIFHLRENQREIMGRMAEFWTDSVSGVRIYRSLMHYWAFGISRDMKKLFSQCDFVDVGDFVNLAFIEGDLKFRFHSGRREQCNTGARK